MHWNTAEQFNHFHASVMYCIHNIIMVCTCLFDFEVLQERYYQKDWEGVSTKMGERKDIWNRCSQGKTSSNFMS